MQISSYPFNASHKRHGCLSKKRDRPRFAVGLDSQAAGSKGSEELAHGLLHHLEGVEKRLEMNP
jgi:hypothetical protein